MVLPTLPLSRLSDGLVRSVPLLTPRSWNLWGLSRYQIWKKVRRSWKGQAGTAAVQPHKQERQNLQANLVQQVTLYGLVTILNLFIFVTLSQNRTFSCTLRGNVLVSPPFYILDTFQQNIRSFNFLHSLSSQDLFLTPFSVGWYIWVPV